MRGMIVIMLMALSVVAGQAQETRELGGDTFNFYIDAKNVQEFIQLVEMAKSARIRSRMKGEA